MKSMKDLDAGYMIRALIDIPECGLCSSVRMCGVNNDRYFKRIEKCQANQ